MKRSVLMMQSMPGPATIITETGGPGLSVRAEVVKEGRHTKDVDGENHQSLCHEFERWHFVQSASNAFKMANCYVFFNTGRSSRVWN